ncbi:MAG: FxsA family protein [Pseudomonadota bacterium]
MWLLVAFVAVPLIEIALFIQVGGAIGLWSTLLVVVITAFIGTYLVRQQGLQALARVQDSFNRLENPSEALAHGAMILFSGALLLTPGFFTDAVGFALLIPAVRIALFNWARTRIKLSGFAMHSAGPGRSGTHPDVIDGEFSEVQSPKDAARGPSGWTKD